MTVKKSCFAFFITLKLYFTAKYANVLYAMVKYSMIGFAWEIKLNTQ